MFTSLKNATHKIALGFLTFLACLGLISLFLNKVDAACDPAAGPCTPETAECTDTTGASMPCPPEEEPGSECGDSRTNPCPEEECDPATEECANGFNFEPGGGSGEGCFDETGASVPCPEEECDPATEECANGFNFEPGGGSGEGCFDETGASVPCEEEECDPATEECANGFNFEPGEDPNTPNFDPNDSEEPECGTRANPTPCPDDNPGCMDAAGAPVNCDPNQFDFCDTATENCGNTTDFCDTTTENCGNIFDFCDPQKEICSNFIPECDPTKEICGNIRPVCTGDNCGTNNRIETPKPEDPPKTFTINKAPNLRPAAPDNPNNSTGTTSPPRLASTGPAAIFLIFAPVLGYAISRKK